MEDGLSASIVKKAQKDFEKANKELAKQQAKTPVTGNFTQQSPQVSALASSCGGINYYDGNIFGGTLYVDSCTTNKMIAVIAGGGGASSLVALLPGGAAIAVIAVAVYTIGGAVLSYNNANGLELRLRF